jgi:heat-inducible transcriptional repressor
VSPRPSQDRATSLDLNERQTSVLRAVIASYAHEGGPIGSKTIATLLPLAISPASIRNVLAELEELGLVEKPHASAGRIPTERGLRLFVDALLAPADLAASERREIAYRVDGTEAGGVVQLASELLSRHTRQLGFVVTPRLDRLVLRHVSLVRLSTQRLLVVLIAQTGATHRRVIDDEQGFDQAELDRVAALLNERVVGRTLPQVRERLAREARALRREANQLLSRALELGSRALAAAGGEPGDLVIETHLALLEQPEFSDPRKERLLEVLDQMLAEAGVSVAFGEEIEDPALSRCALVATRYGVGAGDAPLGVLGVIGPTRMDFNRVIPLVDYLSQVVTGKLRA